MSRSYKKAVFQCCGCKDLKKTANAKVRQMKDVPNGMKYKQFYESWNICDYHADGRFNGDLWRKNNRLFKEEGRHKVWYSWK